MSREFAEMLNRLMRGGDFDSTGLGTIIFFGVLALLSSIVGGEIGVCAGLGLGLTCAVTLVVQAFLRERQAPSKYGRVGRLSMSEWEAARAKLLKSRLKK